MANLGTVKLIGVKELEKKLLKLEKVASSKSPAARAINAAVKSGLNPITKTARSKTPKDTGNLRKSIKTKSAKITQNKNYFMALTGFAAGRGQKYDGWYGYFFEKGTKKGIKARRMFEMAFESQKRNALKRTLDMLSKRLNAEFKKLSVK